METKPILKLILDKTCELFDLIDNKFGIMEKAEASGDLSNILRYELMSFLMCLSACDGRISRVEAELIRKYFDLDIYPGHIKELIEANHIGDDAYFEKIPQCLKIAVALDNAMITANQKPETCISDLVLDLFKAFGKEMVVVDEKVRAEEQLTWSRYITMMTRYVADHSEADQKTNEELQRPGKEIQVDYDISLNKIGRVYTLYVGQSPISKADIIPREFISDTLEEKGQAPSGIADDPVPQTRDVPAAPKDDLPSGLFDDLYKKIMKDLPHKPAWNEPEYVRRQKMEGISYLEPGGWDRKSAVKPRGYYYYPYEDAHDGMLYFSYSDNPARIAGIPFPFHTVVLGLVDDQEKNILSETEVVIDGVQGIKANIHRELSGTVFEMDVYILPKDQLLYMFNFGERDRLRPEMIRCEQTIMDSVRFE